MLNRCENCDVGGEQAVLLRPCTHGDDLVHAQVTVESGDRDLWFCSWRCYGGWLRRRQGYCITGLGINFDREHEDLPRRKIKGEFRWFSLIVWVGSGPEFWDERIYPTVDDMTADEVDAKMRDVIETGAKVNNPFGASALKRDYHIAGEDQ